MKKIPFPQANNLELIFNILYDIGEDGISKFDVAKKYMIKDRQGAYYLDTLLFLGFVEKVNTKYFLVENGIKIRLSPKDEMKSRFISELLNHNIIGELYNMTQNLDDNAKKLIISNYLFNKYNMAFSTAKRRAESIFSWFAWINKNNIIGD